VFAMKSPPDLGCYSFQKSSKSIPVLRARRLAAMLGFPYLYGVANQPACGQGRHVDYTAHRGEG
jgi:hypothetical protein